MARTELFVNRQAGGMFSIENMGAGTGSRFFVHSTTGTDGAGYGQNPDSPLATIDYAIGLCTASKGDIIYVMPGHAETISGATSLVMDVAGVKIVGLGWGSLRPTLTYSATASIISWTAANCWLENVVLVSDIDNCVTTISIGALADGWTLKNILVRDGAANKEFLIGVAVAADSDRGTIDGYRQIGLGGGATGAIEFAGGCDELSMRNVFITGTYSSQPIDLTAAASIDVFVEHVRIVNRDTTAGLGLAFHNSTTGFCNDVETCNLKDTVVGISGTGMSYGHDVYYSNAAGASARLAIAADS